MLNGYPDNDVTTAELVAKLLAVQLYSMGVPQGRIGTIVKKSKGWVNALLQGVPRPKKRSAEAA